MSTNQQSLPKRRRALSKLLMERKWSDDTLSQMRDLITSSGSPYEDEKRDAMAGRIIEIITSSKTEQEMQDRMREISQETKV